MNTEKKIHILSSRLAESFPNSTFEVIDDSDKHIGHAGHQGGGRHFTIKIQCEELSNISRVAAHRRVYELFDDLIPDEIHALQIKIL